MLILDQVGCKKGRSAPQGQGTAPQGQSPPQDLEIDKKKNQWSEIKTSERIKFFDLIFSPIPCRNNTKRFNYTKEQIYLLYFTIEVFYTENQSKIVI